MMCCPYCGHSPQGYTQYVGTSLKVNGPFCRDTYTVAGHGIVPAIYQEYCEDCLMMRQEREDLVSGCSIIGSMKAHISMKKSSASAVSNLKEEKQERHSDSISCMPMNSVEKKREECCLMPSNLFRMKM